MLKSTERGPLSVNDSLWKRVRSLFFAGFVVLAPVALTIWLVVNLFLFADGFLGKPIQYILGSLIGIKYFQGQTIHGIGFIALLALILAAGWFAHQYLGKRIVDFMNKLIERIPLINKVYVAILQISQALLGGQREVFKYAVIIEYPKENIYSIGFVTQDTRGAVQQAIETDVVSVFIPTTPNPTSGFLLFVPKNEATYLDLSVEEALKLIISAGAIIPKRGGGSREAARALGIRLAPAPYDESDPSV